MPAVDLGNRSWMTSGPRPPATRGAADILATAPIGLVVSHLRRTDHDRHDVHTVRPGQHEYLVGAGVVSQARSLGASVFFAPKNWPTTTRLSGMETPAGAFVLLGIAAREGRNVYSKD